MYKEFKHTILPWRLLNSKPKRSGVESIGLHENISPIAELYDVHGMGDKAIDNAQFIVKAVNSHYRLKAALKEALEIMAGLDGIVDVSEIDVKTIKSWWKLTSGLLEELAND